MNEALIAAVRSGLSAAANPERAPAMRAYMKSAMPYHGVPMPEVRKICRVVFGEHALRSENEFDETVEMLFDQASHREERYAAVALAGFRNYADYQTPARIPLYRHLVERGAWWDTVDEIASNLIGPILLRYPDETRPAIVRWIADDNLWLRRTSIIVQLTFKQWTDLPLLEAAIDHNIADRDFFVRKAIGWALRQFARTDPDWVRGFVAERQDRLSGLSKREALKHL